MNVAKILDCVIIGGGPAGLTAGIYLARYRRNIIIYDTFMGRAATIPISHNYPGYPNGISGINLLKNLRAQLSAYNVPIISQAVESIDKLSSTNFRLKTQNKTLLTRNVILATGVQDVVPNLPHMDEAIKKGLIRLCPICDAYEVINKKIAVLINNKKGMKQAFFLRDYTEHISIINLGNEISWSKKDLIKLREAEIAFYTQPVVDIEFSLNLAKIKFSDELIKFDVLYSALGCVKNNKLAIALGVNVLNGEILVNKHQQTSVKGFYAVGDIVSGLNQICVAESQAAIAVTAVHSRCKIP